MKSLEVATQRNLSVATRNLKVMSNVQSNETETTEIVFDDPVAYLARFGIEAEVVATTILPAAA